MPSASREIRRKRRVKRNLTLATRAFREEALNRVKVQTVLLSILARCGGEIEISQEDINTTVQNLGRIQYVVDKKTENVDGTPAVEGQFVVRLVATTEPVDEGRAVAPIVKTQETATVNAFTPVEELVTHEDPQAEERASEERESV